MVEFSLLQALVVGPLVGLLATLVMDVVMRVLPEGRTPPRVAAGVLTDTPVDDAPQRLATWVHYVAGAGSGLLFLGVATLLTALLPGTVSLFAAAIVMFGLMVGFFVVVPLPRAGGLSRQRVRQVSRDWAIMAATYLLVATVLFVVLG